MANAKNVLFLCSGGGGCARFINELVRTGHMPGYQSVSVIADRECTAAKWAKGEGLRSEIVSVDRQDQNELLQACMRHGDSVVVSTIHRVLRREVLSVFKGRIVNTHYSLLPAFAGHIGMKSLEHAEKYGCKIVGATTHRVTERLDSGEPLSQVAIAYERGLPESRRLDEMFRAGCISLFSGLLELTNNSTQGGGARAQRVNESTYLINPYYILPSMLDQNEFWDSLRS